MAEINFNNINIVSNKTCVETYNRPIVCDIALMSDEEMARYRGKYIIHKTNGNPDKSPYIDGVTYRIVPEITEYKHLYEYPTGGGWISREPLSEIYDELSKTATHIPSGFLCDAGDYFLCIINDADAGEISIDKFDGYTIAVCKDSTGYYIDNMGAMARETDASKLDTVYKIGSCDNGAYVATPINANDIIDRESMAYDVYAFKPTTEIISFDATSTPFTYTEFIKALDTTHCVTATVHTSENSSEDITADISYVLSRDSVDYIKVPTCASDIELRMMVQLERYPTSLNFEDFGRYNNDIGFVFKYNGQPVPVFGTEFNPDTCEVESPKKFIHLNDTEFAPYDERYTHVVEKSFFFDANGLGEGANVAPEIEICFGRITGTGEIAELFDTWTIKINPVLRVGLTSTPITASTTTTLLPADAETIPYNKITDGGVTIYNKPNNTYMCYYVEQIGRYSRHDVTFFKVQDSSGADITSSFDMIILDDTNNVVFAAQVPMTYERFTSFKFSFNPEPMVFDPNRNILYVDETKGTFAYVDYHSIDGNIVASAEQRAAIEASPTIAAGIVNEFFKKPFIVLDAMDRKTLYKFNTTESKFEYYGLRK